VNLPATFSRIAVLAKAGIGYHGVASLIPPSDLPTLLLVRKQFPSSTDKGMHENSHYAITCPLQKDKRLHSNNQSKYPTLSVVGEGDVTIFIKGMYENSH
jgi:hypothetical protein